MKLIFKILLISCAILFFACKKSSTPESQKPTTVDPDPVKPPNPAVKLSIISFTPKSAKATDTVIITGTGFGSKKDDIWIDFGGSRVRPDFISPTEMKAIIVDKAKSGKIRVSLKDSADTYSEDVFTKIEPTPINPTPVNITGTLPKDNARVGETLIINGSGFGTDPNKLLVKFGTSATVKPVSANNTTLSVIVPKLPDNILGVDITVQNGSESFTTKWSITILKPNPIITDFLPKIVNEGDTLKVFGENLKEDFNQIININFGDSDEDNLFTMYGAHYKSEKELHFTVYLKNKEVRKSPIKLVIYDGSDGSILSQSNISKDIFTTRPLTKVYFVSSSADEYDHINATAKAGEFVTINGLFSITDYPNISVRFNGSAADVKPEISTSKTTNRFKVRIPEDAKSGTVKVSKQDWGAGTTQNALTIVR